MPVTDGRKNRGQALAISARKRYTIDDTGRLGSRVLPCFARLSAKGTGTALRTKSQRLQCAFRFPLPHTGETSSVRLTNRLRSAV